jgi:hypothetical protein
LSGSRCRSRSTPPATVWSGKRAENDCRHPCRGHQPGRQQRNRYARSGRHAESCRPSSGGSCSPPRRRWLARVAMCRRRISPTAVPRAAAASTTGSGGVSAETFLVMLIISVTPTPVASGDKTRLVNEGASSPGRMRQLPGAASVVSGSCSSRCGPGAVPGGRRGRGGRRVGNAGPGREDRSAVSWSRLV